MHDQILEWYAQGKRGVSSEAIAQTVSGKTPDRNWPTNHPHDPADFNRCLMFFEFVPDARRYMDKIAAMSPVWSRLVARWEELEKCFIDEVGLDWCKAQSAPKTYALMREIIDSK